MSGRLEGKSAIVTGAGLGIGRGIALRLASDGARVVVADISERNAASVADEIGGAGGEVSIGIVDVRQRAQVDALVSHTVRVFGGLDILVNNAGVGKIVPFFETTEQD